MLAIFIPFTAILFFGCGEEDLKHNLSELSIWFLLTAILELFADVNEAVAITQIDSSNEKMILSQVHWQDHGKEHTFKLESHITNW